MDKNLIGKTLGTLGMQWRDAIARAIIRQGISPNLLTCIGVLINVIGGALLGFGGVRHDPINWMHIAASVVILFANLFDILDGTVARMAGKVSKFGAFSDSVFDRYSDMALFAGTITYFALRGDTVFIVISAMALVGAIMTSYTRARAESLLPGKYNSGYMERPERVVTIIVSSLFNRLYMGMIFIAILGNLATLHRMWDAHQTAFNLEHPQQASQHSGDSDAPGIIRFFRNIIFWNYPRQTWQSDALNGFLFLLVLLSVFLLPPR
jgi:CDP-diacylglycerol---glycerol-3-phosphate 3-phosphatidyltransferase